MSVFNGNWGRNVDKITGCVLTLPPVRAILSNAAEDGVSHNNICFRFFCSDGKDKRIPRGWDWGLNCWETWSHGCVDT